MTGVRLSLLEAGYCTHPERVVVAGGAWTSRVFPARVALIEHPRHGAVLFDTGYSPRFYAETRRLPARLYAWLTPVVCDAERTAAAELRRRGIAPDDVRHVVVSHFHADHIGGLADFRRAAYVYQARAFDAVRGLRGLRALRAGFLPGLVPSDFEARSRPVTAAAFRDGALDYGPFRRGADLFGDGTVVAVPLEGHATGQLGLVVRTERQGVVLLAADACWLERSYREAAPPHWITGLVHADARAYRATLGDLHALHRARPDVAIVPCHGAEPLPAADAPRVVVAAADTHAAPETAS